MKIRFPKFERLDPEKQQKYIELASKSGKIVLKTALAIGSVGILNYINSELGQYGVKVDYNNGEIHVGSEKKSSQPTSNKPKTVNDLTWPRTPQVIAILSLADNGVKSYSSSVEKDAAAKIFDIGANGDATTIECAITQIRRISNSSYSSSTQNYCTELIGKLGVIAGNLRSEDPDKNSDDKNCDKKSETVMKEGDAE